MTSRHLQNPLRCLVAIVIAYAAYCPALSAQAFLSDAPPDAPRPSYETAAPVIMPAPPPAGIATEHHFWDKENIALFAVSAALSATDFTVTRQNLQSGGRELNPIVRVFGRSTAGLALNFTGETAAGIGLSYFFHKTHHHRLERIISMVNIGTSAGAVSYGLTHR
jgi:hypothetical protein